MVACSGFASAVASGSLIELAVDGWVDVIRYDTTRRYDTTWVSFAFAFAFAFAWVSDDEGRKG
jgi:hypothetical protein